jgi:beta,beta-carotene 9',10'-dioxygenase
MPIAVSTSTSAPSPATAGRLRGFHSGAREIDDDEVIVRGELPPWLGGKLLLNGPALWDLPRGQFGHWFDGLAMLHRLSFDEGRVRYRSRFLRSDTYRRSCAATRPAASAFGTDDPAARFDRLGGLREGLPNMHSR